MKKALLISLISLLQLTYSLANEPKTIMLILGSADNTVLQERIQIAARLYDTQRMDKIIVSGGCGAHQSSICEASIMFDGLVQLGVPSSIIYKEENAKTTVQNYVFSRQLKDEQGQKLIQQGDTLYVVSNHWHAISVAARFQQYDQVKAKYYIEGAISPKENDKLDYVSILHGEKDNDTFIRKALWITPQTSWKESGYTHYLMDSMVYAVDPATNSISKTYSRNTIFKDPRLQNTQVPWSIIDQGDAWYIKILDKIYVVDKKSKQIKAEFIWKDFVQHLPPYWQVNGFTTGVILDNKLLLFSNDSLLIAHRHDKRFIVEKTGVGKDFVSKWPFSWGASNVAGIYYDKTKRAIVLYRNREFLELDEQLRLIQSPSKLNVNWIDNQ